MCITCIPLWEIHTITTDVKALSQHIRERADKDNIFQIYNLIHLKSN